MLFPRVPRWPPETHAMLEWMLLLLQLFIQLLLAT
jgi:hypothetical protein